jgi:flagellar protein FlbD
MIQLTRLNGQSVTVNSDLVKQIENSPDTMITLLNGEKIIVRETVEQIVDRTVAFRRRVLDGLGMNFSGWSASKGEDSQTDRKASSRGEG